MSLRQGLSKYDHCQLKSTNYGVPLSLVKPRRKESGESKKYVTPPLLLHSMCMGGSTIAYYATYICMCSTAYHNAAILYHSAASIVLLLYASSTKVVALQY